MKKKYPKLSEKELKMKLNSKQYEVTQNGDTERAFQMIIGIFLTKEFMLI